MTDLSSALLQAQPSGAKAIMATSSGADSVTVTKQAAEFGILNSFGIESVFFQHPDSNSTAATRDEIREMAALGGVIEICALGMLPPFHRLHPKTAIEIIAEVTPQQAALTTDYFFEWSPPGPETLRMIVGIFLSQGLAAEDIKAMLHDTPRRLLARFASSIPDDQNALD